MGRSGDSVVWAEATFGDCDLGDVRRTRRLVKVGAQLAAHAGQAPVSACRGDTTACEGAYRLLRNDGVKPEAIAEGGFQATARLVAAMAGEKGVMVAAGALTPMKRLLPVTKSAWISSGSRMIPFLNQIICLILML